MIRATVYLTDKVHEKLKEAKERTGVPISRQIIFAIEKESGPLPMATNSKEVIDNGIGENKKQ